MISSHVLSLILLFSYMWHFSDKYPYFSDKFPCFPFSEKAFNWETHVWSAFNLTLQSKIISAQRKSWISVKYTHRRHNSNKYLLWEVLSHLLPVCGYYTPLIMQSLLKGWTSMNVTPPVQQPILFWLYMRPSNVCNPCSLSIGGGFYCQTQPITEEKLGLQPE